MSTTMPSRRNVVRTATWTVPVVAASTAVPAYAASPCATSHGWRLDWGASGTTYSRGQVVNGVQTGTAVVTGPAGTSPLTVTFRSVMSGSMRRDADNLELSSNLTETPPVGNVGGLGLGPGLNVSHAAPIPSGQRNAQEISISFDRQVSGLAFTITDVDAQFGDWVDQVELSGSRTGTGPALQGNGTPDSPWMATTYGNAGNSSGSRNIAVTYTAAIPAGSPVLLKFWNRSGNGNQRIFLSDFTFDALGC